MAQETIRAARVYSFSRGVRALQASVLWLVSAIILVPVLAGAPAHAQVGSDRYAALVIEANTGEVLFSRNANRQLHPASLTKMMTLYMAFQALERGELQLSQLLTVSPAADAMPASHLNLPAGDTIRVEDAILSLVTRSANDMAVVLAEAMGGTESGFARRMTEQARALGMSRTVFRNASGLPDSAQVSTAHDMGILARALLRDFPQYYHYFGTRSWRYRGTSYTNHNRLLHTYDGADGFKTGYIRASGFNLVASATRGNVRLIAVMFGGSTSEERNRHVARILDNAFESARGRQLIASGTLSPVPVNAPLPPRRPAVSIASLIAPEPFAVDSLERLAAEAARASQMDPELIPVTTRMAAPPPDEMANVPLPLRPPGALRPAPSISAGLDAAPLETLAEMEEALAEAEPMGDGGPFVPAPAPVMAATGWSIHIGDFASPADGVQAMDDALRHATEQLASAGRALIEQPTEGGTLYRARFTALDGQTASVACARLTEAGAGCVQIAPVEQL